MSYGNEPGPADGVVVPGWRRVAGGVVTVPGVAGGAPGHGRGRRVRGGLAGRAGARRGRLRRVSAIVVTLCQQFTYCCYLYHLLNIKQLVMAFLFKASKESNDCVQ